MDTFVTLRDILVEKFDKDAASVTADATLESLEIDSLETFELIFEAEDKFGITVPNDKVDIKTFEDVVKLVDRLRNEQAENAS